MAIGGTGRQPWPRMVWMATAVLLGGCNEILNIRAPSDDVLDAARFEPESGPPQLRPIAPDADVPADEDDAGRP